MKKEKFDWSVKIHLQGVFEEFSEIVDELRRPTDKFEQKNSRYFCKPFIAAAVPYAHTRWAPMNRIVYDIWCTN